MHSKKSVATDPNFKIVAAGGTRLGVSYFSDGSREASEIAGFLSRFEGIRN